MTGRAEVVFDGPEVESLPGAERLWRFAPATVVRRAGAWPLRDAARTVG